LQRSRLEEPDCESWLSPLFFLSGVAVIATLFVPLRSAPAQHRSVAVAVVEAVEIGQFGHEAVANVRPAMDKTVWLDGTGLLHRLGQSRAA
jgi:hypothetical protein